MACGLSIPSPGWCKSLDQGSSSDMDEAPEVREKSFCKSEGDQQDETFGLQGLHPGRSDPCTDILLFCA